MDEGAPVSYLLLARDTPVYGSGGELVGKVKQVLCEPAADIFDGLRLATPDGDRYVSAEHVAAIHAQGVDLTVNPDTVANLPEPRHQPRIRWDLEQPPAHLWEEIAQWLLEHLPHRHPARDAHLRLAQQRISERQRAIRLACENPQLAAEMGIGRPDLPGTDDCGVIDINHVPAEVIATLPGSFSGATALDVRGGTCTERSTVDGPPASPRSEAGARHRRRPGGGTRETPAESPLRLGAQDHHRGRPQTAPFTCG